jgi:hypothetical protein
MKVAHHQDTIFHILNMVPVHLRVNYAWCIRGRKSFYPPYLSLSIINSSSGILQSSPIFSIGQGPSVKNHFLS